VTKAKRGCSNKEQPLLVSIIYFLFSALVAGHYNKRQTYKESNEHERQQQVYQLIAAFEFFPNKDAPHRSDHGRSLA